MQAHSSNSSNPAKGEFAAVSPPGRCQLITARQRAGGQQQPRRSGGVLRPNVGSATLSAYVVSLTKHRLV